MSVVRLAVLLALTLGAATVADPLQVHRDAVVVDLHVDTLLDLAAGKRTLDGGGGQVDIPRLRQGGVDVQVFAAYIDPGQAPRGKERARELITAFHRAMDRHADAIASARTVEEIPAAGRAGKIAAVLSVENLGDALQGEIEQVDRLYREGVRLASLTWNPANLLADGARETRHGGLSPLGRRVVARMQELGMIVDVSHLSAAAFWDVLAATRGPVVAPHSDAAALQPHRRNRCVRSWEKTPCVCSGTSGDDNISAAARRHPEGSKGTGSSCGSLRRAIRRGGGLPDSARRPA